MLTVSSLAVVDSWISGFFVAWAPGPLELVIIGIVGLLIFGKRLPEIARNLGRGVVEFKKGIRNVEDDIDTAGEYQPPSPPKQVGDGSRRDDEVGAARND